MHSRVYRGSPMPATLASSHVHWQTNRKETGNLFPCDSLSTVVHNVYSAIDLRSDPTARKDGTLCKR